MGWDGAIAAGEPAGGPAWADPIGLAEVIEGVDAGGVAARPALVGAGWDMLGAGPCGGDCPPARGAAVGSGRLEAVPATDFTAGAMVAAMTVVTVPTAVRASPATGARTPVTVRSAGTTVPSPTRVTVATVLERTVVTFGATVASVCGDTVDVAADRT